MRIDVFNSKVAAEKHIKQSGQWDKLSPEDQRLVEKMVSIDRRDLFRTRTKTSCDRFWMVLAQVLHFQRNNVTN